MTNTELEIGTRTNTQLIPSRLLSEALSDAVTFGKPPASNRVLSGTQSATMAPEHAEETENVHQAVASLWDEFKVGVETQVVCDIMSNARQRTAADFSMVVFNQDSFAGSLVDVIRAWHRPLIMTHPATVLVTSEPLAAPHHGGKGESRRDSDVCEMVNCFATQHEAKHAALTRQLLLRRLAPISGTEDSDVSDLHYLLVRSFESSIRKRQPLSEIRIPHGPLYPFRRMVFVTVQNLADGVKAWIEETEAKIPLEGRGASEEDALRNLAHNLDVLIQRHRKKPPHLHADEDEEINRILEHLIDWDRFRQLNPIEQPLWGRVEQQLDNGGIRVCWVIGPNEERGEETTLKPKDVCAALREIPVGGWFYGSGKVYPSHIEWISQPVVVPDPNDREAIRAAWDLIPRKVVSKAEQWPHRDKE